MTNLCSPVAQLQPEPVAMGFAKWSISLQLYIGDQNLDRKQQLFFGIQSKELLAMSQLYELPSVPMHLANKEKPGRLAWHPMTVEIRSLLGSQQFFRRTSPYLQHTKDVIRPQGQHGDRIIRGMECMAFLLTCPFSTSSFSKSSILAWHLSRSA